MEHRAKRRKLEIASSTPHFFNDRHNPLTRASHANLLEEEHIKASQSQGVQESVPTLDMLPNEIQQMILHHLHIFDDDEAKKLKLRPGWNIIGVSKRVQANMIAVVEGVERERSGMTKRAFEEYKIISEQYRGKSGLKHLKMLTEKTKKYLEEIRADQRIYKWLFSVRPHRL